MWNLYIIYKISCQDPVRDLLVSVPFEKSLHRIPWQKQTTKYSQNHFMPPDLLAKLFTTAQQPERCEVRKTSTGLRRCSPDRKGAAHGEGSTTTHTTRKYREGCSGKIKMRTTLQWERSDTHKVPKRLHMWNLICTLPKMPQVSKSS